VVLGHGMGASVKTKRGGKYGGMNGRCKRGTGAAAVSQDGAD
jgi:hypothetical protein